MSPVSPLGQDSDRRAPDAATRSGAGPAAMTERNPERPKASCQHEQNGSWSYWIEVEESVVRQHWGSSRQSFAVFKEVAASLGFAITRAGPNRIRFSIYDILDEAEQRDVAAHWLAAFSHLFLESRQLRKASPANAPGSPSPMAPEATAPSIPPAQSEEAVAARPPEPFVTAPATMFPSLFTDEAPETTVQTEANKETEAKAVDYLALIKESYPRIAAAIELTWGNVECENYINKLVLNDRNTRQGFPPPIMHALLALYRRHVQEFDFSSQLQAWSDVRKRDGTI